MIEISVTAEALGDPESMADGNATAYGAEDSHILGGRDDDVIVVDAMANSAGENAVSKAYGGVASRTAFDGTGDDTITIKVRVNADGSAIADRYGIGVLNGSILRDQGNYTISISASTLSIQDALISGGVGNDILDVGPGSGTVDGGSGVDVRVMDFFDTATMTLVQLDRHRF